MSDRMTITETDATWVVRGGGAILAETERALRLDEAGREPVIYFPREDIAMALLERSETRTSCPGKGEASHFSLQTSGALLPDIAWSYEQPVPEVEAIRGRLAFYPERVTIEEV